MNKLNYIKRGTQILFCSLFFASCSDWTDTESLTINTPTLEDVNPELYEAYLNSLREYKASEHKVVIAKFDNKETNPRGQGEHLTALPDSIDYVILNNPDNLNPVIAQEMEEIRVDKGTKSLYTIDYNVILQEYKDMIKEQESGDTETPETKEGEGGNEGETTEVDGFLEFCKQKTEASLGLFDKYKYDGINVAFVGRAPLAYPEQERMVEMERQKLFFGMIEEWKKAHQDATLLFEGTPENIIPEKNILKESKFIIIPAIDAKSMEDFIIPIYMSIVDGVPTDRYIMGTTMPSITDSKDKKGYLYLDDESSKMYAVIGAAYETIKNVESFVKSGICIEKTENDYYSQEGSYRNISEAINIMNLAPLNF